MSKRKVPPMPTIVDKPAPRIVSLAEAQETLRRAAKPVTDWPAPAAPAQPTITPPAPAAAPLPEDPQLVPAPPPTPMPAHREYPDRRIRVSLALADGTFTLPAISVLASPYSITVLFPMREDSVNFMPFPGVEVTVSDGDRSYACYYPGASFEIPELCILGLVFIRKEE